MLPHALVDPVRGETRQRGVLGQVERLGLLCGRGSQRAVEELVDGRPRWLPSAHSHLHAAEAGRRRAVADVADLDRLTLAAVRQPPQRPLVRAADRVAAAPETAA